jgi:hypothetical protein
MPRSDERIRPGRQAVLRLVRVVPGHLARDLELPGSPVATTTVETPTLIEIAYSGP